MTSRTPPNLHNSSEHSSTSPLELAGTIRPVIDKVFPFDQAKEAQAYLEKSRAKGKVVVQMKLLQVKLLYEDVTEKRRPGTLSIFPPGSCNGKRTS